MSVDGATPGVRALNCPNCGGPITLHAAGYTVSLICPTCGGTLDATDPDLRLIGRTAAALRVPAIPLGTRGTLDGAEWAAIGYLERDDGEDGWSETLLFNPYRGYRWLACAEGDYMLGEVLDRAPDVAGDTATLNGREHEASGDPYETSVTFVVGEFPWRVSVGERVTVRDYEGRATTLSVEGNAAERTWTLSRALADGVVARAFGLTSGDSPSTAYGAPSSAHYTASSETKPGPGGPLLRPMLVIAVVAIGLLAVIAAWGATGGAVLLREDIPIVPDAPSRNRLLGPIMLTAPRGGLTVAAEAALDNGWIDLDYSLVNRATQETFDASGTAEAYHGRDEDGDWREGNPSPRTRFAGVPAGTYDLVTDIAGHSWSGEGGGSGGTRLPDVPVTLHLTVRRGASFPENVWLAIFLIALWPAILLWRRLSSAGRRGHGA